MGDERDERDERRGAPRYPASLAGEIDYGGTRASIAITRDVSAKGLLVLARHDIPTGTAVKLRVLFRDREVQFAGTVVRNEPLPAEEATLWRLQLGIAVDPSAAFDELMAELATAR